MNSGPYTRIGTESDDELTNQTDNSAYISLLDAVPVIFDDSQDTLATPDLEQAAFRRIDGYPGVARQHIHYTKAWIPQDVALALLGNPGLVQKAVEAFYTRDAPQMRAAARMSRFPPSQSVLATVKLTRTAYAQLISQKFRPPKIFGDWNEKGDQLEWRRKDIGMKIACGFEMMYQESKVRNEIYTDGESMIEARRDAVRRDPEYVKYINSLQNLGYFKGELRESAQWQILEDTAVSQFIHSRRTDDANRSSFASLVTVAISQARRQIDLDTNYDFARQEEDSDEWLSITKSMMENMLSETSQGGPRESDVMDLDEGNAAEGMASESESMARAKELRGLAEKVTTFIEGEGDVQGAMFEDDLLSDDADDSESVDSDDESGLDSNVTAERQTALDRLVPPLDASEYGTMPASFHSGSQKVKAEVQIQEHEEVHKRDLPSAADTRARTSRPLIFPRDQFDGAEDSDDESEEEDITEEDGEEDEDRPQVVGEVEIDMKEEEEEFLKFSRETLGISADMWKNIIQDRKDRGAFLPESVLHEQMRQDDHPTLSLGSAKTSGSGVSPGKNVNLNSFEAVMQAMDAELSRIKSGEQNTSVKDRSTTLETTQQRKGKGKAMNSDEDMDSGSSAAMDSSDEDIGNGSMDYTLMKNFLESFKSQQGLSGPVSNLIGRLGGQLPRDDS